MLDQKVKQRLLLLKHFPYGKCIEEQVKLTLCFANNQEDLNTYEKKLRKLISRKNPKDKDYKCYLEKLCLFLIQQNKMQEEVTQILQALTYRYRLSNQVLSYQGRTVNPVELIESQKIVKVVKNALPPLLFSDIEQKIEDYFNQHEYSDGTLTNPSHYFSYLIKISDLQKNDSIFMKVIDQIHHYCLESFPEVKKAKFVEFWAHNRPHCSGHQMHFDSDDEGRGGIRNPIVSTVVYLTSDIGGPTLVTQQTLNSEKLSEKGWLVMPKKNNLCIFNGKVLHGVVPGKSYVPKYQKRITLMFAFWEDINERNGISKSNFGQLIGELQTLANEK